MTLYLFSYVQFHPQADITLILPKLYSDCCNVCTLNLMVLSVSINIKEFHAAKKEGSGFMSRMADSLHNMSASYMMKNRSAEFTVMNEYVNTFSEKLGTIDRVAQRVSKEQYGTNTKCLNFCLVLV